MFWLGFGRLSSAFVLAAVFPVAVLAAPAETGAAFSSSSLPASGAGIELVRPVKVTPDPCLADEVVASPTRPSWDNSAITTQCGVLESDFGAQWQAMGGKVGQWSIPSSMRYGITQRLDLRWGQGGHQWQSGGQVGSIEGDGDHWLGARYRFHEQGRLSPALALGYSFKVPIANPAKGFGSGHADHQLLFLASRDFGRTHVDFSIVGTLAGAQYGHDDAAQLGMVLSRPLTRRLSVLAESYGGPQQGLAEPFGAVLGGGSFVLRPWLVLDAAYAQAYTEGQPRRQAIFGFTCARRAGWRPIGRGSAVARMLGR